MVKILNTKGKSNKVIEKEIYQLTTPQSTDEIRTLISINSISDDRLILHIETDNIPKW